MSSQDVNNEPENGQRGPGRPSKYGDMDLDDVERFAAAGLTDKQIAELLGIAESTLNEYKKVEEFSESIKRGKAFADEKVERALFERATGYSHPEEKIFCNQGFTPKARPSNQQDVDDDLEASVPEDGRLHPRVIIVPTVKHYPPDVTACIFWLKNRKPKDWKDKQEVEHSGKVGVEHSAKVSLLGKLQDAIAKRNSQTAADGQLVSEPDGASGEGSPEVPGEA